MALNPVRHRSTRKREQIRLAAQRLFLTAGVASTSMDAITAEAGVSKQTVYAYYPSKEALVADVLHTLVATRTVPWEDVGIGRHPLVTRSAVEQELLALANTVIDTLMRTEYLGMARVVVAESARNPELGELFRQQVAGPVIAGVGRILDRGIAGGVLADVPTDEAARMLVGVLLTYILLDGLLRPDGPRQPPAGTADRAVALLLDGLARR